MDVSIKLVPYRMNSPSNTNPKYSIAEVERRWLVPPGFVATLEGLSYRILEDLYIGQTMLRLRKVTDPLGDVVYKLCKKYGQGASLSNPMTNIYLSQAEYQALSALDGTRVCKRRYSIAGGAVDVYPGTSPLVIFEIEFESEQEAQGYLPPNFVGKEVTGTD